MLGAKVIAGEEFRDGTYRDVEGDEIPKEKMLIFEFGDHTRIAVRASGTEPKIKYYLFAQRRPERTKFSAAELAAIKQRSERRISSASGNGCARMRPRGSGA